MGAWGFGPFENDDAMDFIGDLSDAPRSETPARLRNALTLSGEYLESPEASMAVASAALIATKRGYETNNSTVTELLGTHDFEATEVLRSLAHEALDRASGPDSELRELWDEAGAWDNVEPLYEGIRGFL